MRRLSVSTRWLLICTFGTIGAFAMAFFITGNLASSAIMAAASAAILSALLVVDEVARSSDPLVLAPAALSGVLLWLAFFPLNIGLLGFVALVPWLTLVRTPLPRWHRYVGAYFGGLAFFTLATNWVRVAHEMMYFSWLGFSLVLPLFWVLGLYLIRRLDRLGLPLALSVPVVWVALEYMRMHFPTGYPFLKPLGIYHMIGFGWYFLGYTQHAFLPLIQIADLGGVYAVSFVVAAVNGLVADWALRSEVVRGWLRFSPSPLAGEGSSRSERVRGKANRIVQAHPSPGGEAPPPSPRNRGEGENRVALLTAIAVLSLLFGSVTYGFVRLQHPEFAAGPKVAAIQASVGQSDKMSDTKGLFDTYNELCLRATRDHDLVIWPETCYPWNYFTIAPGVDPAPSETATAVIRSHEYLALFSTGAIPPWLSGREKDAPPPWRANVLLGTNSYEWDGSREVPANTALLVDAEGRIVATYDKMHLVPFGEYVPLRTIAPWMSAFTPYKHDYSCRPGESWTRFPLTARDGRTFTFGCLICYEDSDPYLARHYVATEPVNFLVNISNDGWFDGTEEHEEHLAICRFRAIEARRAIVRSVNMGISGLIDADGRVVKIPGETWSQSKKMEAVVSAVVPIDNRDSLYAMLGDWIPAACWGVVVVGLVLARVRKVKA